MGAVGGLGGESLSSRTGVKTLEDCFPLTNSGQLLWYLSLINRLYLPLNYEPILYKLIIKELQQLDRKPINRKEKREGLLPERRIQRNRR
jgi:hypothetical protein